MPVKISHAIVPGALRYFRDENFLGALSANQNDFVAQLDARQRGHIHHRQVHRDASEHRTTLTADQNRRVTVRERARETIRVTGTDRGDPHRPRGDKGAPITDAAPRRKIAQECDA